MTSTPSHEIEPGATTYGVDLGGTHVRIGRVDHAGAVVEKVKTDTPDTLDGIVDTIAGAVEQLRTNASGADGHALDVLGVGAAGMVDRDGVIHYSPNVPAFIGAPVAARLEAALGMPVTVDNDANVAALAELVHGAVRGHTDALVITLGTGVGGGIVTGGRVLRGAHGFGGEVGHFQVDPHGPACACGETGHWEALASGTALGALARARAGAGAAPSVLARAGGSVDAVTGALTGDAALAGEADAIAIVHEFAVQVAIGLVGLVNVLDSEVVVVSGGLIDLGDLLLDPIREAFRGHLEGARYRPEVPVMAARLGDDAGLVGAAVLARELVVR
ncbi:MAG: ROK family protein [Acidimicrobiia bacterium]